MPAHGDIPELMRLNVADLALCLDARGSGIRLAAPGCHALFVADATAADRLTLRVRDGPLLATDGWHSVFYDAETWQLWRNDVGQHIFVAPKHSPPPRQVVVDSCFRTGEVVGEFGLNLGTGHAVYPLQDADIVLFANWLAEWGDLILHAAGVNDAGAGYAFVGPSGAGKSTLAASVASGSSATVLGEDSVILRCVDGRFVVYGTPWHTNAALCSPGGVPLKKLFFLERAAGCGVRPLGRREGVERLLQDAFIPYYNSAGVARILSRLVRLAEEIPFYTLGFKIGSDVMGLIRGA